MADDTMLEQVQSLMDMLTGEPIDEKIMHLAHQPKLTRKEAFSMVYYLQEEMHLIPDRFEMCSKCEVLYDSFNEGGTLQGSNANLCNSCASDYSYCVGCCQYVPYGTTDEDGSECPDCQALTRKDE